MFETGPADAPTRLEALLAERIAILDGAWGVLLQDAQNVQTVAITPWLMLPVAPVIVVILAFNFLGDGLRDAADPYGV